MLYLSDDQTIYGEHGVVLRIEPCHPDLFLIVFTCGGTGSIVKEFSTIEDACDYITSVCALLRQSGNVVLVKE